MSEAGISTLVHDLLFKAGVIVKGEAKRYPVRPHSLRKYFKTQLEHLRTIPTEYIEYMMGHTISTYNSVDVEHLRSLYSSSGLSIRPKTEFSKLERLKMFAESLGLNPDEVLTRDALSMPHRTVIEPEARKIEILVRALGL